MPNPTDLLDLAASHLGTAADLADHHSDRHTDNGDEWAALAGQIRLVAACLPTPADTQTGQGGTVAEHLAAAVDALDHIDPLEGPHDLQLWAWHIAELARLTPATAAS